MTAVLERPQQEQDTEPWVITEPGVYDLPAEVYHSDPVPGGSLSSSGAKLLLPPSCPAKFRYDQLHGSPDSGTFDAGRAAHKMVLGAGQPILVVEADSWRGKAAQEQQKLARRAGMVPLLTHQYEQVTQMAEALRAHPVAGPLLRPGTGMPERSLFWVDPEFRIWRRAMLDFLRHHRGRVIVADYKTCKSAEPEAISRAIAAYGYHMQGSWYLDAVNAVGPATDSPVFLLVFQEKTPPYLVTVAQPDPETIQWGRQLNRRAISEYRRCRDRGVWPGYGKDQVLSVSLPHHVERSLTFALECGDLDPTQPEV